MKKKGNRHKTQRAHRRALKRAAIITMAGAAVIIGAFCPVGMPLKVKILLALLALVVSFVVMSLKNLIFMQYGS